MSKVSTYQAPPASNIDAMDEDAAAPPSYHQTVQGASLPATAAYMQDKKTADVSSERDIGAYAGESSASGAVGVPMSYAGSPDWAPQESDRQLTALEKAIIVSRAALRRSGEKAKTSATLSIPSFQRAPGTALGQTYGRFADDVSIPSMRDQHEIEFKPQYPGVQMVDHDVSSADWAAFLEDLQVAAKYSAYQKAYANIAPVTQYMTVVGLVATRVVGAATKTTTNKAVFEVVERWNEHCFQRRRLDV